MSANIKIPFYIEFAFISIGAIAFILTLYIGQQIILPLIYGTILAILLNPFVNFLIKKKINKIIAISTAVAISIFVLLSLIYFISVQASLFAESYPALKQKLNLTSTHFIHWLSTNFNIKTTKINSWVKEIQIDTFTNIKGAIMPTLYAINSLIVIVILIPVYLFMILYYKNLLLEFIRKLFKSVHHVAVFEILFNSKKIIQSYLTGLLVEAAIVATLNSVGLLILGIDYAIILGISGALLNVIPYIGGVIAITLPMIIAYISKDSSTYALLVLLVYLLIQFIDNNIIVPRIVASRVKINALISVIAVIIGGAMWGIPGMFLSIPLTAILKVIFDHVEKLKPWGFLLGNIVPTSKLNFAFIKKKMPK